MKVAITADVHLTTAEDHPERYNALENILDRCLSRQISHLVIAGDLFDRNQKDFGEFEAVCGKACYADIGVHIIRGNHDARLRSSDVTADNIHVADEPSVFRPDPDSPPFLLVPYEDSAMGEIISSNMGSFEPERWILVGHGDFTGGERNVNPHEKGVYMPLMKEDINRFKPAETFLGHIHKSVDSKSVHYPGSPCGLDITETGTRTFIVYETLDGSISREIIDTDVLWFNELFTLVPSDDETERVRTAAAERIKNWNLPPDGAAKARIRISVQGYAQDRNAVYTTLKEAFSEYRFPDGEDIDAGRLKAAGDHRLGDIAARTVERIRKLKRPSGREQPDDEQIILTALEMIYRA